MDIHETLTAAFDCESSTAAEKFAEALAPRATDSNEDGSPAFTFRPWTDGHAVGFEVERRSDGAITYVYLDPGAGAVSNGKMRPGVSVCMGTKGNPSYDFTQHSYNIDFNS